MGGSEEVYMLNDERRSTKVRSLPSLHPQPCTNSALNQDPGTIVLLRLSPGPPPCHFVAAAVVTSAAMFENDIPSFVLDRQRSSR